MRVGRLLRSTEGVGAESHRFTGSQGRREESQAGKQAGWRRRGTNGAARLTCADTTCDETMVAWQGIAQVGVAQAGVV